jgi:hypothetical protein
VLGSSIAVQVGKNTFIDPSAKILGPTTVAAIAPSVQAP